MSVYVIAELPFSEQGAKEYIDWTKSDDGSAITKASAGYGLIQTLLAEDNKTVYLYEKWASKEEHKNYLNMRVEGGLSDWLGPRLEGEFKINYFNDVD